MTVAMAVHLACTVLALMYLRTRIERTLSVTGLTLGALIFIHGIPLPAYLIFTGPDTMIYEAALMGGDRDLIRSKVLFAVALMLLMVVAGCEAANVIFPRRRAQVRRASITPPPDCLPRLLRIGEMASLLSWALVLCMLIVSVLESHLPKVISYFASAGSESERIFLRREGGGTPYYLYNVVLAAVAPFMTLVIIAVKDARPRSTQLRVLLWAMLGTVLLGKFGTLSKAPPVFFVLQVVLVMLLLRRKKFTLTTAIALLASSFVLFLFIVYLTIPDLDLTSALRFLYYRIFDIPNEALLEYFASVPALIPHGWGAGIFSFLRSMPDSEYVPMYFRVAAVTRNSLLSTSNGLFINDAWAEFGWPGVALFSFLAGMLVRTIDLHAFMRGESDLSACIVAGCSYGVFTMLSTSLTTALVTGGLLLIPPVAWALRRRGQAGSVRRQTIPHPPTTSEV